MATREEMLALAEADGFRFQDEADLERYWRQQQLPEEWLAEFNERTEMAERFNRWLRQRFDERAREMREAERVAAIAMARHKTARCRPLARRPKTRNERPRVRRTRQRPSSTAPPDPDHPAPEEVRLPTWLLAVAETVGVRATALRWCRICHTAAYCVDDYQAQALDRAGWTGDLCPRHARGPARWR
jgi:hypothetical protein